MNYTSVSGTGTVVITRATPRITVTGGTATALVRAARSGNGNGRVYEIQFTASDGKGGACEGRHERRGA